MSFIVHMVNLIVKARIVIGIGIAIVAIVTVVFGLTIFTGSETNKSTGPGQNSTSLSPPPGRHFSVDLHETVGIRQNP